MHQRSESQVGQFLLATVGDDGFGGALERHVAVLGGKGMAGQAVHQAATLHPADGGAPSIARERVSDARAQRISGVAPQILRVVVAGDALFVVEAIHLLGRLAIRHAHQDVRQRQAHVARVFRHAEAFPPGVLGGVEDLGQIARSVELCVALQVHQIRRCRRHEGSVGGCRHLRHPFQELDVLGAASELVVAQQAGERLAAEDPELLFVDLLEHLALVELGHALQVAQDLLFSGVEDLELQVDPGLAVLHQVPDAAPGGLQFLEFRVVQDLVDLQREQVVDLRDALVDHRLQVRRDRHLPVQHLLDELRHQASAPLPGRFVAAYTSFGNDLV